jgi:hypothetical protein
MSHYVGLDVSLKVTLPPIMGGSACFHADKARGQFPKELHDFIPPESPSNLDFAGFINPVNLENLLRQIQPYRHHRAHRPLP